MNIRPTNSNLLIRRAPAVEQRTASGLLLSAAPEKPQRGTVIAAGPGWYAQSGQLIPTRIKEGDEVVWSKLVEGAVVNIDVGLGTEELIVISEDVVVAVIVPTSTGLPS